MGGTGPFSSSTLLNDTRRFDIMVAPCGEAKQTLSPMPAYVLQVEDPNRDIYKEILNVCDI